MAPKLNPNSFSHEADRRALENLKSIPGFTPLLKWVMRIFDERQIKLINLSSRLKVGPEQCPRIYKLLTPICEAFGIPVPDIYLQLDRTPNAYATGASYISIIVNTGLLEIMDDHLVQAVLAHECGHIVCGHVLYRTMAEILVDATTELLGLGAIGTEALKVALAYWKRCSELSADRAAAIFNGEPDTTVDVMMYLAAGCEKVSSEFDRDLFIAQADQYLEYAKSSGWNRILEFLILAEMDHPLLAVRAKAILDYAKTKNYINLVNKLHGIKEVGDGKHCPHCGAPIEEGYIFCRSCGKKLDEEGE